MREKGYADLYTRSTANLYKQEGQVEHFTEVQDLLASLVSHFSTGKKSRLDAQTTREIARKPTDNASLSVLVIKQTHHVPKQELS